MGPCQSWGQSLVAALQLEVPTECPVAVVEAGTAGKVPSYVAWVASSTAASAALQEVLGRRCPSDVGTCLSLSLSDSFPFDGVISPSASSFHEEVLELVGDAAAANTSILVEESTSPCRVSA